MQIGASVTRVLGNDIRHKNAVLDIPIALP